MAAVPTVKVHYNGSWAYINQDDFDPQVHLEWQEGDEVIVEQLKAQAAEEAAAATVFQEVEAEEPIVPQGAQEDGSEPPAAEPVADEPESEDSEDEEKES